jgi:CheY-like chemotaxis protein
MGPTVTESRPKTVLLVDDDPVIVKLVSNIVTSGGFKLLVATSGAAALQLSKGYIGEIDLLLSDFQMPQMSGIGLATQITHDRPKIKVLLISGFPEGILVLNEGWHFLAKPFIPSQLLTLISGLITPDKPSKFAA